jgi:hypothetical protein
MPIRPGDMLAVVPGQISTMISDGKRMRVLWSKGHGDGDPSVYLIERSMNNLTGHPTWKLFCGDIFGTIVREKNEPPRYVYLDDRACYDIWKSREYDREEQKTFWPFDFDYLGNIKTARTNKGRPAYVDDACTQYATGSLRDKKKVYVFSGASDYRPNRNIIEVAGDSKVKTKPTSGNNEIEEVPVDVSAQRVPNAASLPATVPNATTPDATILHASSPNATASFGSSLEYDVAGDPFDSMSSLSSDHDDAEDHMLFDVAPLVSQNSLPDYPAGAHNSGPKGSSGDETATRGGEKRKRKPTIEGMPFGKRVKW